MSRTHPVLVRGVAVLALLGSVVGFAHTGQAATSTSTYTSSALHFKLAYPTTWKLIASTRTSGPEAKISPTIFVLEAPDQNATFLALVRASTSSTAVMKANVATLLQEGNHLMAPIKFQTGTANGLVMVQGTATDKHDGVHHGQLTIVAGSKAHFTWYTTAVYYEKYTGTRQDQAALNAMMDSFTPA